MARGKTFSITIPHEMVKEYDRIAKELGMSRSKVIFHILLNEWNNNSDTKIIDCGNADGIKCSVYGNACDQKDTHDCIAYTPLEGK